MIPVGYGVPAVAIRIISDTSGYIRDIGKLTTITKRAGASIQMALATAGAGLLGVMTSAIRVGKEFQTQLMFTAQISGATGDQMRNLEYLARKVGKTTAFSAAQAAESMYTFASAGYTADEMLKAILPTLQLAGGQVYDLGGTTEMMVSTLKMFSMSTTQATRVADAFTVGNIRSLLTMEKLRYAIGYAGPVAYGFGMSIEECVAALAAFSNLGLEGSRIGVGFRMMMKEATKSTYEKVKALQKYKLAMADINPSVKKFIGILETVAKVNMTVSDSLKVFGARTGAYVVAMASMLKTGELDWNEEMQAFAKGIGKTQELYENMMTSWQNQWLITKNVIGDVLIAIFTKFTEPAIGGLAKLQNYFRKLSDEININGGFVTKLGEAFNRAAGWIGEFVAKARAVVGVIIAITNAVLPLASLAATAWGFGKVTKGLQALQKGSLAIQPSLKGVTSQVGKLSTGFNWFINGLLIADFAKGGKRAADTAMVLEGSLERMAMGGIAAGKGLEAIKFQHFVAKSTQAVQASKSFNIIKESVLALGIAFAGLGSKVKTGLSSLATGALTFLKNNWLLVAAAIGTAIYAWIQRSNQLREEAAKLSKAWTQAASDIYASSAEKFGLTVTTIDAVALAMQRLGVTMDYFKEHGFEELPSLVTDEEKAKMSAGSIINLENQRIQDIVKKLAKEQELYEDERQMQIRRIAEAAKNAGLLKKEYTNQNEEMTEINKFLDKSLKEMKEKQGLWAEGSIEGLAGEKSNFAQALRAFASSATGTDMERQAEAYANLKTAFSEFVDIEAKHLLQARTRIQTENTYISILDRLKEAVNASGTAMGDMFNEDFMKYIPLMSTEEDQRFTKSYEDKSRKLGELRIKADMAKAAVKKGMYDVLTDLATITEEEVKINAQGVEEVVKTTKQIKVSAINEEILNTETVLAEELRMWKEAQEKKYGLTVDGLLVAKQIRSMEAEFFENEMQKEIRQYKEKMEKFKHERGLASKDITYIEAKEAAGIGQIRKKYFDQYTNEMQMDLVKRGEDEFAIERENIDKRVEYFIDKYEWADKQAMDNYRKARMEMFAETSNKEFFDKAKEEQLEAIATLGMDEYQIREYNIQRELKLQLDALEKQKKMNEESSTIFKEYEEAKVLYTQGANAKMLEVSNDRMEEEAKAWNEQIDKIAGDFKKLFTESINSEWEGFGKYFEQIADRIRNTFLDLVVTMVSDWLWGMAKMKIASSMIGAAPGAASAALGYPASGAPSTAAGTGMTSGIGGFVQKAGMMIINQKLGKSILPQLIHKFGGEFLGITNTSSVAVGGTLVPVTSEAATASLMPGTPYASEAAMSAATTEGPAYFTPGMATLGIAAAGGGLTGGLVGGNYAQTHGKAAGAGMAAGVGATAGAGIYGGLMAAGMAGGPWGMAAAAVLSAIAAAVPTLMGPDPTKRKRQARGRTFGSGMEAWREGEYSSLGQMMGTMPKYLLSAKSLYAAQHYLGANVPHSQVAYVAQGTLSGLVDTYEKIGALTPMVSESLSMVNEKLSAYSTQVGRNFAKSAQQMEELRVKMIGLFKEDVLGQFQRGIITLQSVREQLQEIGLEDAETRTQMYDAALANLFNSTMPLGEVQLERLYEGMAELREDMDEATAATAGMEILTASLAKGLDLTADQLERFRDNSDNLAMLQNVDIYQQMGIEKIALAESTMEDFDDTIAAMRTSIAETSVSIEQFNYLIDTLPINLEELRGALQGVSYILQSMTDIVSSGIDVFEDIGNLPETFANLQQAIEAGDIGAVIDSYNEFANLISDTIGLVSRLAGVFDSLNFTTVAGGLTLFTEGLTGILLIIQVVNTVLTLIELFTQLSATMWDLADASHEAAGTMEEWTKTKIDWYDTWIKPLIDIGVLIRNNIGAMNQWDLLPDDWGDLWGAQQEVKWEDILNIGEAKDVFLDIEDMFWSTGQLSHETWVGMTRDMHTFLRTIDEGQAVIDAEALAIEAARYFDYMYQNWETLVQQFGSTEAVESIIQQATDYYAEKLADLVDAAIQAWKDFREAIQNQINVMDTEIVSLLARAGKLWQTTTFGLTGPENAPGILSDLSITVPAFTPVSDEVAEFIKWTQEAARIAALGAEAWEDYNNAASPEEQLQALTEVQDYLQQQMDAELAAIDAYYSEQERLIRERYELENENLDDLISKLEDMKSRYESFTKTSDDLLKDVRMGGTSDAEQFNAARREVNRIKAAIGTATTPEEKMDLYDTLLEAYESLWSSGQNLYQEDWKAYKRLQEEIIAGVEEAKDNGSEFYETEIAAIQALIDAVLDGQTYDEYTANNTQAMEDELELLYQARAADKAELIAAYQTQMESLGGVVTAGTTSVAEAIYDAFEDMFQTYIDWSAANGGEAWWLDQINTTLGEILDEARKIVGLLPDGGGGVPPEDLYYTLPTGTGEWWEIPAAEPIDVMTDVQEVLNALILEFKDRGMFGNGLTGASDATNAAWMLDRLTNALVGGLTTQDDLTQLGAIFEWLEDNEAYVPSGVMYDDTWSTMVDAMVKLANYLEPDDEPPTPPTPLTTAEYYNLGPKASSAMWEWTENQLDQGQEAIMAMWAWGADMFEANIMDQESYSDFSAQMMHMIDLLNKGQINDLMPLLEEKFNYFFNSNLMTAEVFKDITSQIYGTTPTENLWADFETTFRGWLLEWKSGYLGASSPGISFEAASLTAIDDNTNAINNNTSALLTLSFPPYQKGGIIPETGNYELHKGELVVPTKDVPSVLKFLGLSDDYIYPIADRNLVAKVFHLLAANSKKLDPLASPWSWRGAAWALEGNWNKLGFNTDYGTVTSDADVDWVAILRGLVDSSNKFNIKDLIEDKYDWKSTWRTMMDTISNLVYQYGTSFEIPKRRFAEADIGWRTYTGTQKRVFTSISEKDIQKGYNDDVDVLAADYYELTKKRNLNAYAFGKYLIKSHPYLNLSGDSWSIPGISAPASPLWDKVTANIDTEDEAIYALTALQHEMGYMTNSWRKRIQKEASEGFWSNSLSNFSWLTTKLGKALTPLWVTPPPFNWDLELDEISSKTLRKGYEDVLKILTHKTYEYAGGRYTGRKINIGQPFFGGMIGGKAVGDILNVLQNALHNLPSFKTGGYVNSTGIYNLHAGETVVSPYTTGEYGLTSLANDIANTITLKTNYAQPAESGETVFVFVPYQTSPQEQERIFQDVKQRMHKASRNEQFIYDKAIIKTNRGV